jgi:peroxiredoxin
MIKLLPILLLLGSFFTISAQNEVERELYGYEKELFFYDRMSIGQPLYNFTRVDLQGDTITLDKLKGKIVILNVFSAHKPACFAAISKLKQIQSKYKNKNVEFLAISPADTRDTLIKISKEYDWLYRIIPSEANSNPKFAQNTILLREKYFLSFYPTTIVIDQDGLLAYAFVDFVKDSDFIGIEYTIDMLLKAK